MKLLKLALLALCLCACQTSEHFAREWCDKNMNAQPVQINCYDGTCFVRSSQAFIVLDCDQLFRDCRLIHREDINVITNH